MNNVHELPFIMLSRRKGFIFRAAIVLALGVIGAALEKAGVRQPLIVGFIVVAGVTATLAALHYYGQHQFRTTHSLLSNGQTNPESPDETTKKETEKKGGNAFRAGQG